MCFNALIYSQYAQSLIMFYLETHYETKTKRFLFMWPPRHNFIYIYIYVVKIATFLCYINRDACINLHKHIYIHLCFCVMYYIYIYVNLQKLLLVLFRMRTQKKNAITTNIGHIARATREKYIHAAYIWALFGAASRRQNIPTHNT